MKIDVLKDNERIGLVWNQISSEKVHVMGKLLLMENDSTVKIQKALLSDWWRYVISVM